MIMMSTAWIFASPKISNSCEKHQHWLKHNYAF
jgi:hypothetical protein